MKNHIVWCDIPVKDIDRAITFYSAVLGSKIEKQSYEGTAIAAFGSQDGVGGRLHVTNETKPSADGPLIYLNCDGRLDAALGTVPQNGGKVLKPKQQIGPYGFRAVVLDSEGNRIALHSK
jgi:predicted enzyme related to lactoylglutathione lyase